MFYFSYTMPDTERAESSTTSPAVQPERVKHRRRRRQHVYVVRVNHISTALKYGLFLFNFIFWVSQFTFPHWPSGHNYWCPRMWYIILGQMEVGRFSPRGTLLYKGFVALIPYYSFNHSENKRPCSESVLHPLRQNIASVLTDEFIYKEYNLYK